MIPSLPPSTLPAIVGSAGAASAYVTGAAAGAALPLKTDNQQRIAAVVIAVGLVALIMAALPYFGFRRSTRNAAALGMVVGLAAPIVTMGAHWTMGKVSELKSKATGEEPKQLPAPEEGASPVAGLGRPVTLKSALGY